MIASLPSGRAAMAQRHGRSDGRTQRNVQVSGR
jgi:hypothetical protein